MGQSGGNHTCWRCRRLNVLLLLKSSGCKSRQFQRSISTQQWFPHCVVLGHCFKVIPVCRFNGTITTMITWNHNCVLAPRLGSTGTRAELDHWTGQIMLLKAPWDEYLDKDTCSSTLIDGVRCEKVHEQKWGWTKIQIIFTLNVTYVYKHKVDGACYSSKVARHNPVKEMILWTMFSPKPAGGFWQNDDGGVGSCLVAGCQDEADQVVDCG